MRTMFVGERCAGMAVALLLLLPMVGCGDEEAVEPEPPPVPTTVEVTPDAAELLSSGTTAGFNAVVRDQDGEVMPNASVTWTSSDPAVFTVEGNGLVATVTAVANGMGTLTATTGQVSGTASVTVVQTPAMLGIVSGDDQEGLRGTALAEPVVMEVTEQTGGPIPGVVVTLAPADERSGSVDPAEVTTGADGRASTMWTLGDKRRQMVVARVEEQGLEAVIRATALADPPIPDYTMAGGLEPSRFDPLDTDTVEIGAHITNLGDGPSIGPFTVRFTVDGAELETVHLDPIEPDDTATVTITAGPFEAGTYRIGAVIDPDGEFEEWEETNNEAEESSLTVRHQQVLDFGGSATVDGPIADAVLLYRVDVTEPMDQALTVRLTGPTGDGDLYVDFNDRPDHFLKYRCFSWTPETVEVCQLYPVRVGTYNIAVHVWTPFETATLSVAAEAPADPFNLELVFLDNGTASQNSIIAQVAERWESMIGLGLFPWITILSPGACGPDSPNILEYIDDIRVFVSIDSIDGTGGRVASSGPCHVRDITFSGIPTTMPPTAGGVILDVADIARLESDGVLESVVTHQMAHALGVDHAVWNQHGFLQDPSVSRTPTPDPDTHFDAPLAVAAFDAAGGLGYSDAKVPVENGGEPDISDRHWRASVFGDELMTPYLTGDFQPLSRITLEALYEIGYEINITMADAFTLAGAGVAGGRRPQGPVIYLGNDVAPFRIRVPERSARVIYKK